MTSSLSSHIPNIRSYLTTQLGEQSFDIILALLVLSFVFILFFLLLKVTSQKREVKNLLFSLRQSKSKTQELQDKLQQQSVREAKLITLLKNERKHTADKLRLLEQARAELKLQFEHLAGRIFEEKSSKFSELNKEKLDTILQPFNKELLTLRQEMNNIYQGDSWERLNLKHEINNLRELNQQINQEAINLTNALKSDTKTQGNWGELILDQVLQRSGLRHGFEYDTQNG